MKRNTLFSGILIFTIILCSFIPSGQKSFTPPGTGHLYGNLYLDIKEISNLDYREFLFWLDEVFGSGSIESRQALPDSMVWPRINDSLAEYSLYYFRHPAYNNYPVVGLNYEQAQAYCDWRSDRVYEYILFKKEIIPHVRHQTRENHFTIQAFLENKLDTVLRAYDSTEIYPIPRYRLPTASEWEFAASGGLSLEAYPYGIKKTAKLKANTYDGSYRDNAFRFPASSIYKSVNRKGFYNMIGNVAEMTSVKGEAKGGSWSHMLDECAIKGLSKYQAPQAWLGIRCACELDYGIKNTSP